MSFNNPTYNSYRDAFLLDTTYIRRLEPDWPDGTPVFPGTYGWFAGGSLTVAGASATSRIDRIDFANDSPTTALVRGSLPATRWGMASVGNANFGWLLGGSPYPALNTTFVNRVEWANDLLTASSRGPLVGSLRQTAATGNANFGFVAHSSGAPVITNVQRITYSNDLIDASVRGTMTAVRYNPSAAGTEYYGYWAGGSNVSTVDRVDFSNDSPVGSSPRGPLNGSRFGQAATSNSNFMWVTGGGSPQVSTIERIDFANDLATPSIRGLLDGARNRHASAGNFNFGWFGGGTPGAGVLSTVSRIDYSNDSPTTTSVRGPLSGGVYQFSGTSNYVRSIPGLQYPTQGLGTNEALAGYSWMMGGLAPGTVLTTIVDRLDHSNDNTTASVRGPLSRTRFFNSGMGNANYGWTLAGSSQFTGNFVSSVDRIDYANDSPASSVARSPLASVRYRHNSTGNANFGWTIGGFNSPGGTMASSVDRTDYSNDLAAPLSRGPLPVTLYMFGATANTDYGWVGAGGTVPNSSSVYRIDFSNDSSAASTRGPLTLARFGVGASGNANYGWFGGGLGPTSIIERVDFSNDSPTSASVRGPLTAAGPINLSSAGNAAYGWFIAFVSTFSRIDYSNDSPATASSRGSISGRTAPLGITSNYVKPSLNQLDVQRPSIGNRTDGTFGWFGGGIAPGITTSTVQRIDFANDSPTSSSIRGPLSVARERLSATGNTNFGWFGGGFGPTSVIDRVDFANDSPATASVRGPLSLARTGATATGNQRYGWFGGGSDGTQRTIVDRVDFANDSPSSTSVRGPLFWARSIAAATSNENYGWWASGDFPSSPGQALSAVERIDFSNDALTASVRGPLSALRRGAAAVGNRAYGYWAGGYSPFLVRSWIDRIDLANDSPTSSTQRGPLTITNSYFASASSTNFGWFTGGVGFLSTVNRIEFANDNVTASARGFLTAGRGYHAGTSNYVKTIPIFNVTQYAKGSGVVGTGAGTFGWFGGARSGASAVSTVDRIDFSNDSPTSASVRSPLSSSRYGTAAIGNANYGWFGGGRTPVASSFVTTIDRIDFSNDSPAAVAQRGPLSLARAFHAGASNANYGWVAGGNPTAASSIIDRIDFSNDGFVASSRRGPLSSARYALAATSNANFGWFGAGGFPVTSVVDRIDFSNDSPTSASPRGPLSSSRYYISATGNANFGWFGGGALNVSTFVSTIDRIDFSNDSPTSASVRGPLSAVKNALAATGNANFGWFGGGAGAGTVSIVERIDFSNDSPTSASVRGPLSLARFYISALSNYTK